ncbi:MAG: phytanoyl-CoA dioxygenase family protein [Chloroflexota bacterium]
MLTQEQKDIFETKGLLHLESFLPLETVNVAQDYIRRLAEKEGAWQDGAWQLSATSARPNFTKPISKAKFEILSTPEMMAAIQSLVSGQALEPGGKPSLLFTLPQNKPWTMLQSWHTDCPRQPHGGIPGVQMFTFLDTVMPRGGGTMVVTGSHRLVNDGTFVRSKDIKKRLRKYEYFGNLTKRDWLSPEHFLSTSGSVGDVELQVVELHGEPRDVYLMDLRLLHTISTNTANIPRLMVTQRYYLEETIHSHQEK